MSGGTTRAAVIQMSATTDKDANLATAERLVRAAVADGAALVALPEYFSCYGRTVDAVAMRESYGASAEPVPGPTTAWLSALARELSITLLGGSIFERSGERIFNTSTLFDAAGTLVATYRKTHLFEARAPELTYHEGSVITPGDELVTADVRLGDGAVRVGMSVCYDVRFPELYCALVERGAEVLMIPSAFPRETGRDHWELLLRARAVDNQAYVLAPAQWGMQADGGLLQGRSAIVDPRGTVLATCPDGEGYALATIEWDRLALYRERFPNGKNRRPELYRTIRPAGGRA